jgi:ATP-dependent DNA helicase RecG
MDRADRHPTTPATRRGASHMRAGESPPPGSLKLGSPLAELAGVGPRRAQALAGRGLHTVEDLLFHLPARYQDWRERVPLAALRPGIVAVVEGTLERVRERPMRGARWRRLVTATLVDDSGARLKLVWFNLPAYMSGRLPQGRRVAALGRVVEGADGQLEMAHPEIAAPDAADGAPIRPIYRLPEGINQRMFAKFVAHALEEVAGAVRGAIPEELRVAQGIAHPSEALEYLHRPPADADLAKLRSGRSPGHVALALDELFAFELAMCLERERMARRPGLQLCGPSTLTDSFVKGLPFKLTRAQLRALDEIGADLESSRQMNRILIGDVGSGKTAVAFWAALRAIESGAQAAIMAPTEILAEQHHRNFSRMCARLGVMAALLTGNVIGNERQRLLRALSRGEIPIVFGTHALIQENVRLARLGLAIVDEQHRFGVFDRARLKSLGPGANVLMMTATPIPRSLAMTLLANLDVSILDELPPGRTPVATALFEERELPTVHRIVREEVARGRRAYYVLPLIGEDSGDEAEDEPKSVAVMAARLKEGELRDARIGVLHGRMRPAEKERVMREFRDGALDVLVSTTVVEVGVDVPQATVIVIVAAERYGLAQLHQLRGRVGRGRDASRCCLVVSAGADSLARERLDVLVRCGSGAEIAEEDLRMRGPGDLLGARQTGALPLRFARFINDLAMIAKAREMAEAWLRRDPALELPASAGARAAFKRMLEYGFSLADVG